MNIKAQHLKKLLPQLNYAGVYHLPHSGQGALDAAARELGFMSFHCDLADTAEMGILLSALGRSLGFPDWYGGNLDALHDCLTDLSWHEAPGYILTLSGADTLHTDAAGFSTLNDVFTDACAYWKEQGIPFWIFYDLRADGLASLPTLA